MTLYVILDANSFAFAELLTNDAHDVFGVAVVFGEDQRLGEPRCARGNTQSTRSRKVHGDGRIDRMPQTLIQVGGGVADIFIGEPAASGARRAIAIAQHPARGWRDLVEPCVVICVRIFMDVVLTLAPRPPRARAGIP